MVENSVACAATCLKQGIGLMMRKREEGAQSSLGRRLKLLTGNAKLYSLILFPKEEASKFVGATAECTTVFMM